VDTSVSKDVDRPFETSSLSRGRTVGTALAPARLWQCDKWPCKPEDNFSLSFIKNSKTNIV